MSEREMLEYAAKACGLRAQWCATSRTMLLLDTESNAGCEEWNPKDNSGDGAEMEAKLGIEIKWFEYDCDASVGDEHTYRTEHYKDHDDEKQPARRMASLRVAAEIGKAMK